MSIDTVSNEFVSIEDKTLVTDSLRVAKRFGKQHRNVLRAIDGLDCGNEFRVLNFEQVIDGYQNGKGGQQERRLVRMTKDGFMLLAMGFTGKEAMRTKIAFINAFNGMADQLQQIGVSLWNQRLDLEKRDATTFMWASFGAKQMNARKKALPQIKSDRARLEAEMQPSLIAGVMQ